MRGLLPVTAPLQRTFRVDQQVGDVLHIAYLLRAAAHLQQGVVRRGARVDGIEAEAVREARAPTGSELPVLALDVVHPPNAARTRASVRRDRPPCLTAWAQTPSREIGRAHV